MSYTCVDSFDDLMRALNIDSKDEESDISKETTLALAEIARLQRLDKAASLSSDGTQVSVTIDSTHDVYVTTKAFEGASVKVDCDSYGIPHAFIRLPNDCNDKVTRPTLATVIVKGRKEGEDARAHLSIYRRAHGPCLLVAILNVVKRSCDVTKEAVMTFWK